MELLVEGPFKTFVRTIGRNRLWHKLGECRSLTTADLIWTSRTIRILKVKHLAYVPLISFYAFPTKHKLQIFLRLEAGVEGAQRTVTILGHLERFDGNSNF